MTVPLMWDEEVQESYLEHKVPFYPYPRIIFSLWVLFVTEKKILKMCFSSPGSWQGALNWK